MWPWLFSHGNVLLYGHNRLKICRKNNIEYETSTIEINNINEAVIWIVDNQKGRRNVATREQQDYISGKRYEAQKNIDRKRDKKGVFLSNDPGDHNEHLGDNNQKNGPTAVKQAREEGITPISVRRNASFARGIDAVREVSPELAEKILKPEKDMPKIPKYAVAAIRNVKEKEPDKFVEWILDEFIAIKGRVMILGVLCAPAFGQTTAIDWNDKGNVLVDQGKYNKAIKAADKAIEINSQYAEAWFNKGLALYHQGKYSEAIQAYDRAIEINPQLAEAWYNKGNALKLLGRTTEADAAFAKAGELGDNGAE